MYYIYGKRTLPVFDLINRGGPMGPDKTFRPLDSKGLRVYKKVDAKTFNTKEEAQNFIDSNKWRKGVVLEVRKG